MILMVSALDHGANSTLMRIDYWCYRRHHLQGLCALANRSRTSPPFHPPLFEGDSRGMCCHDVVSVRPIPFHSSLRFLSIRKTLYHEENVSLHSHPIRRRRRVSREQMRPDTRRMYRSTDFIDHTRLILTPTCFSGRFEGSFVQNMYSPRLNCRIQYMCLVISLSYLFRSNKTRDLPERV